MDSFAQISGFITNFPFLTAILTAFFLLYWTNVFFIVYHLTRFGIGPVPKLFALVFLLGSILLFSLAVLVYGRVDFPEILHTLKAQFKTGDYMNNFPKFPFSSGVPIIPPLNTQ